MHIEMEEFSDFRFKQRAVVEFLTAEIVPPIEIQRRMQAVYGDQCVDVSTVRRCVRWNLQRGSGFKNKTFFLRTDFKNYCSVGGSVLKCLGNFVEKYYAALKIIDVGIFLLFFYFNKVSFPVHFLFKWRQNLTARPRIRTTFLCTFTRRIRTNSFTVSVSSYTKIRRNFTVKFRFWFPW